MRNNEVKAKCRRCNREVPTSEFTLDPVYGMMVCASCSKERRSKSAPAAGSRAAGGSIAVENKKPAGWDKEDEYIEKAYSQKMQNTQQVQSVGEGKVKYACHKCKYEFVYNVDKNTPSRCPFCNSEIMKFRVRG
jgi:DNA-directed RNA polymerase subunit RPC12/RpoP